MFLLPYVTVLLWLSTAVFVKFNSGIAFNSNVLGPVLVLLTVLLPVSFWILLEKTKWMFSLVMILIFMFNLSWFGVDLFNKYKMFEKYSSSMEGVDPDWIRMASDSENSIERKNVARAIFQKHGVKIAYRMENEAYALYSPTTEDRGSIMENIDRRANQNILKRNLRYDIMTDAFLISLQMIVFLLVFVYLAFSSKRREYSGGHSSRVL
ncbi:hypothetical protein [Desulfopila sp. IMCC35008]|uniref:hypothetical protein n=1 Tax=Desulfopila sp. IMCC35008 TaxID=2653858 RepID=UPI0013CF8E91|nr:hypothetical protein [Desulfopila sp. IMCC35008]